MSSPQSHHDVGRPTENKHENNNDGKFKSSAFRSGDVGTSVITHPKDEMSSCSITFYGPFSQTDHRLASSSATTSAIRRIITCCCCVFHSTYTEIRSQTWTRSKWKTVIYFTRDFQQCQVGSVGSTKTSIVMSVSWNKLIFCKLYNETNNEMCLDEISRSSYAVSLWKNKDTLLWVI